MSSCRGINTTTTEVRYINCRQRSSALLNAHTNDTSHLELDTHLHYQRALEPKVLSEEPAPNYAMQYCAHNTHDTRLIRSSGTLRRTTDTAVSQFSQSININTRKGIEVQRARSHSSIACLIGAVCACLREIMQKKKTHTHTHTTRGCKITNLPVKMLSGNCVGVGNFHDGRAVGENGKCTRTR